MQRRWPVLQVAATYMGTVVGAGFASGQSIMQFFSVHGVWGAAGVAVSTLLFVWFGIRMMVVSARINAHSYTDLNRYLFGKALGGAVNAMIFATLLAVTAVMLSGTGSLFEEQLGIPAILGIAIAILLTYLVLMNGITGIIAINALVVPMMLFFALLITVNLLSGAEGAQAFEGWMSGWNGGIWSKAHLAADALTYAALNFAFAQAVLVPLGSEIGDETTLRRGGLAGGIGLGFMLLVNHLAISARMPEMLRFDVPIGEIIRDWGRPVHLLFVAVICGEIFTTLIGNVFGMTRQIAGRFDLPKNAVTAAVLLAAFAISLPGFASLVTYLYPLLGYMGLVLLAALAIKK